ncbi:phage major capsid protein [Bradyrhizobium sp. JYMT SZCCT0428]|uniref:phage major capsid protein n=1 Tax=Bradyrhizobium sp. JYMT SZCCT0428 TaxID=2807673 RepID=UPI001BA89AAD|nr:phage major capsid protein [Bradyrhizobium sp. JYMT SZCCT0428]MBR1154512.1 phage major capsid protein [Bradyrhizobium sp. JYMT SZCCT0428]
MVQAIRAAADIEISHRATAFAHFAALTGAHKKNMSDALKDFEIRFQRSRQLEAVRGFVARQKAAISSGTTTDTTWAAPLVAQNTLERGFIEYYRTRTVLDKIQGFRRVPFNVRTSAATSGTAVSWVDENQPTPVSAMSFEGLQFTKSKIGGIVVITQELARSSDPAAPELIRDDLAAAMAQYSDEQFLNPSIAATGASPASIVNGATEITSSGTTLAAFTQDLEDLLGALSTNLTAPYIVMRRSTALWVCRLKNESGSDAFPSMGAMGGQIWGIPVIVSDSAPLDSDSPAQRNIVALDAAEILVAEGGVEFRTSTEGTIEMVDTPDSPTTGATVQTSLWQRNLIAIGVNRFIRWQRRRDGAAAFLSSVPF